MKLFLIIIFFACILDACTEQRSGYRLFTLPGEKSLQDSVSDKIKQSFKKGYVEYFIINNTEFRFQKSRRTKNIYELQSSKNDKWSTNLVLPLPRYTYDLTRDLDLDHNFDLTFYQSGNIRVHFFDQSKRQFDSTTLDILVDHALLDSTRVIYGTNNRSRDIWNLDIFSIKNRSKIPLFKSKLFLLNNSNDGGFEITKAFIYKCMNGVDSDTVLVDEINIKKQFKDFSLRNFMKTIVHNPDYRR